jgi:hypothetical protein
MRTSLLVAFALTMSVLGCQSTAAPSANTATNATTPLPTPLATAAEHVRGFTTHIDDAGVNAAFSTQFLASVPREKIKAMFVELGPQVGACTAVEPIRIESDNAGSVRIVCATALIKLKIATQPAAPYLMDGLLVEAKPR